MDLQPGEIITLREGIETVQNLAAWLKGAGERSLGHKGDDEIEVIDIPNAARAGRTLILLMQTSGLA